ncbi:MAG: hypothetical protein J5490_02615 [Bacteroidales bacterium]|nr:hypothetical protein [Bacteroidales bacterium]
MKAQTATATLYTESTRPMLEIEKEETKDNAPRFWQAVLVGGIPGILIGSTGTKAVEAIVSSGETATDKVSVAPTEEVSEVQVAHNVTNDMSFDQAFAAARAEIGPGGAFVWHGNVYTTFRADDAEWQEMTDEARSEFGQQVISQVPCPPYAPTENEPEIVAMDEARADDVDIDVHIVGVEQIELESGASVVVGYGGVDGHYSEFIDSDGDGEVDTVLIDANDNRHLEPDEIYDAEGAGITVDDMVEEAAINNGVSPDEILNPDVQEFTDNDMNIPV